MKETEKALLELVKICRVMNQANGDLTDIVRILAERVANLNERVTRLEGSCN